MIPFNKTPVWQLVFERVTGRDILLGSPSNIYLVNAYELKGRISYLSRNHLAWP